MIHRDWFDEVAEYETSSVEDKHLKEWALAENDSDERLDLPYAVYGTLRPGCGNDRLWEGMAYLGATGVVEGYKMVTGMSMGFPFALPAPHSSVVVEIIVPAEGFERVLRDRLDTLEGYPHFYDRKVVKVETISGFVEAWLYVPCTTSFLDKVFDIPSGDWVQHRSNRFSN